jgi:ribonuclease Z
MQPFNIHILGCGSALPTVRRFPSAQVVDIRNKLFMVDCGEGAQLQFRKSKLNFNRLRRIFISHLHGDHCFGLIGLISSLELLGKTGSLVIHAILDMETILHPQLDYFCRDLPFDVKIEPFNPYQSEVIYTDRSVEVRTIPLHHRVPCAGFLFREQAGEKHIIGDMIKFHNIPVKEIAAIKKGADYTTPGGIVIPNERLTRPADPVRSYAYCSDTAYSEKIVPIIKNADLLYHEATFSDRDAMRAKATGHSTAGEAAQIAKLANVKKLMLGHFSSRYENCTILLNDALRIFPNTILANENLCEKL